MNTEKLDEIYELIRETGYIQSLNMYREMDDNSTKEYNLILVISTCPYYEGDTKIKLMFHNVQEFKLGNSEILPNWIYEQTLILHHQLMEQYYGVVTKKVLRHMQTALAEL